MNGYPTTYTARQALGRQIPLPTRGLARYLIRGRRSADRRVRNPVGRLVVAGLAVALVFSMKL